MTSDPEETFSHMTIIHVHSSRDHHWSVMEDGAAGNGKSTAKFK